jgi:hypothetical protein
MSPIGGVDRFCLMTTGNDMPRRFRRQTVMPRALALLLLAALTACGASTGSEGTAPDAQQLLDLRIESGTSFGMCAGYCTTRLVVEGASAVFTETAPRTGQPDRTRSLQLTAVEQARLFAALDTAALRRLSGVHGCPDCADGGAEWIEHGRARVTFEHGAELAPIAPLQREIRALRGRFPR